MEIEFTDRYGGHAPSWLRGCHGDCEATGCVPVSRPADMEEGSHLCFPTKRDERYDALWREAERKEKSEDGWHFVRCIECDGTGRVSWLRTIYRIPKWLWRGFKNFGSLWSCRRNDWSAWKNLKVTIWALYGADLERLFK